MGLENYYRKMIVNDWYFTRIRYALNIELELERLLVRSYNVEYMNAKSYREILCP